MISTEENETICVVVEMSSFLSSPHSIVNKQMIGFDAAVKEEQCHFIMCLLLLFLLRPFCNAAEIFPSFSFYFFFIEISSSDN